MNTKTCKKCNNTLSLTNFHKNGFNGHHPLCKICRSQTRRAQAYDRKEGLKICPKCEKEIHSTNFDSDKSNHDGLQTYCKKCKNIFQKARLNTFNGFIKNLFKDLKYNAKNRNIPVEITLEDIKELYEQQNHKCALTDKIMTYEAMERINNQHIINKWNISIDRIDSKKGYTKDNIQLICAIVNRYKMHLSQEELMTITKKLVEHNQDRINDLLKKN